LLNAFNVYYCLNIDSNVFGAFSVVENSNHIKTIAITKYKTRTYKSTNTT